MYLFPWFFAELKSIYIVLVNVHSKFWIILIKKNFDQKCSQNQNHLCWILLTEVGFCDDNSPSCSLLFWYLCSCFRSLLDGFCCSNSSLSYFQTLKSKLDSADARHNRYHCCAQRYSYVWLNVILSIFLVYSLLSLSIPGPLKHRLLAYLQPYSSVKVTVWTLYQIIKYSAISRSLFILVIPKNTSHMWECIHEDKFS